MTIFVKKVIKVNIAFDMSFTQNVNDQRGIGRYAKSLLRNMIQQGDDHSFFYFYPDLSGSEEQLRAQLQQFLHHNQIDLFHILSPFEYTNAAMMNKEWYGKTKVAVTLYDIIPLLYQHIYLTHPDLRRVYLQILNFVKACDVIFAISQTTKQDAVRHAAMDPDKIHVIMAGLDEKFTCMPDWNRSEWNARYGIRKPYVMCTSGMDFRKNTTRLIEGFARANRALRFSYQLVLCCSVSPSDIQQLKETAQRAGASDDLVITGYVPDDDLVKLYNGASLFAFPSLYEGFGLPVVEAMACGVPVLTSHNSSLAEISGDAAYLVNPESSDEIAAGIYTMLTNPDMQTEYRKKGFQQADKYQWSGVARKVWEGYRLVTRKHIAIFSPVPPVHSGISNYLVTILPTLLLNADCDLYIDDGYTPELPPELGDLQVYNHKRFPEKAEQYDTVIYQMGNSQYHEYMVPYLRKYSGIVVVHDVNLHGLTMVWTLGKSDVAAYYEVLRENIKSGAEAVLHDILAGNIENPTERLVLNKYYVKRAKAVVVHNQYSYDALLNEGISNIKIVRLPVRMPTQIPTQSPRPNDNRFVFASFGYFSPHKHLEAAIRCMKRFVEQGWRNVEYQIVGNCESDYLETLVSLVQSLQLESHVTFFGHLPKEEYHERLRRADAAITLRYPTCGETSSSLLDALSYGIPTIVSDIGSFREFPDGVVLKVPVHLQDESPLYTAMLKLYQDQGLRTRMSRQAKHYVSHDHSVEQYVEQLNDLIESVCKQKGADIPPTP
jgi:glycosyltransferase involved in cell wall biosynthesis